VPRARPTTLRISDVRSVWGPPLELPLGAEVTVLVGPNRSGTSNVAWALAAALAPGVRFRPGRDRPYRRPDATSRLEVDREDGSRTEVAFGPHGARTEVIVATDGRREVVVESGAAGPRRPGGADGGADPDEPVPAPVVLCAADGVPRDVLRPLSPALGLSSPAARERLAASLSTTLRRVLPEVAEVSVSERLRVEVADDLGSALALPLIRALVGLGVARHLHEAGRPAAAAIVEAPEAMLHPGAQELAAQAIVDLARDTGTPVVVTTTSPFVIPRNAGTRVVALARDAAGCTRVVGSATGDRPQARLLGGLLRDTGLAGVLDRVGAVPADTRAVLIVEGGTDEAFLRLAAERLGRQQILDGVVIQVAGGAMPAALAAIVLRAERDVPLLVLLDHDDNGRRARHTLVERFGFDRGRQVLTYADVVHGQPVGVEAETLFDLDLLRRFVAEQGRGASHGERWLETTWHVELTGSGKSALVGWLARHARPEHLDGWARLLDRLEECLP
jgi:5S rRNA maturation endonuclease (ribonuclease M5)